MTSGEYDILKYRGFESFDAEGDALQGIATSIILG